MIQLAQHCHKPPEIVAVVYHEQPPHCHEFQSQPNNTQCNFAKGRPGRI